MRSQPLSAVFSSFWDGTIVKQNIAFALSFIVLLLFANFTGNITMPLGVIGHEGSTVLVTLSGLRLLRN